MTPVNVSDDNGLLYNGGRERKRILICDDEEAIRLLLAEALQDSYDIVEASNGREALKLAASEHIDLIIIDIKMPQVHGLEAIERIRERDGEIPIIICSAYPLMEDDIVVKTSNIAAFITKPIDIEALKAKIAALMRS